MRETEAEERKGRGGGIKWRRDGASGETFDSLSPPPGLQGSEIVMALSGGDGGGRRHRAGLARGEGTGLAVGGGHSHFLSGGGDAGFSRQIELPPCPVCFDRLDPAVAGIPVARAHAGTRGSGNGDTGVAGAIPGSAARCNHRGCNFEGETVAGDRKPESQVGKTASSAPRSKGGGDEGGGCGCGSDTEPFGRDTRCTAHGENIAGRGKHADRGGSLSSGAGAVSEDAEESRGPRWEGESAREGGNRQNDESGARGHGRRSGGSAPALNTVIWKGSTCRVCRSLNVALEGAPDEVSCSSSCDWNPRFWNERTPRQTCQRRW